MVYGRLVPFDGRSLPIQAGSDTRSRQDSIHSTQHGKPPSSVWSHAQDCTDGEQNLPGGIFDIMQGYMKYASTFNIEGSEF